MGQACAVSAKESADGLGCTAPSREFATIESGVKRITKSCEMKPSSKADNASILHERRQPHAAYHKRDEHRKIKKSPASFSSSTSTTSTSAASEAPTVEWSSSENSNTFDSVRRLKSESASLMGSTPSEHCSSCAEENQETPTSSLTGSVANSFSFVSWCATEDTNYRITGGDRPSYKLADAPSKSAPAVLERESLRSVALATKGGSAAHECLDDTEGDCLPPDGIVWVEGQNRPQPLTTVTAGQRVLCHDIAFGGIKYAPVTEAHVEEQGDVDWVEIVLQDGTTLPMTADHPMKTEGPGNPVRAVDIKPGQDSIMVLKLVPVPVERINKCVGLGSKRASVAIAQPSRHTLLVGSAGQSELMTVGSVDLGEIPRLKEELTFLDLNNGRCDRAQRRANSAPPAHSVDVRLLSKATTTNTPDSECASLSASHCDSSGETSDSFEEAEDTEMILVGTVLADTSSNSFVKLSDLLSIKAKGLKSHGSQDHATRRCRVCVFENRFFHDGGKPCFKELLCEYCHDDHPRSNRLKKRGTRAGQKMDKRYH